MGGPGAEQARWHELNVLPQEVGYGDRPLMTVETLLGTCHRDQNQHRHSLPENHLFVNPLAFLYDNNNNTSEDDCHDTENNNYNRNKGYNSTNNNNNNNKRNCSKSNDNYFRKKKSIASDNAKAAMSSPPKHRRGFETNDPTGNDFRRYRRVKTRQRSFAYLTPLTEWTLETDFR